MNYVIDTNKKKNIEFKQTSTKQQNHKTKIDKSRYFLA